MQLSQLGASFQTETKILRKKLEDVSPLEQAPFHPETGRPRTREVTVLRNHLMQMLSNYTTICNEMMAQIFDRNPAEMGDGEDKKDEQLVREVTLIHTRAKTEAQLGIISLEVLLEEYQDFLQEDERDKEEEEERLDLKEIEERERQDSKKNAELERQDAEENSERERQDAKDDAELKRKQRNEDEERHHRFQLEKDKLRADQAEVDRNLQLRRREMEMKHAEVMRRLKIADRNPIPATKVCTKKIETGGFLRITSEIRIKSQQTWHHSTPWPVRNIRVPTLPAPI